jgi:hypothetical protein
MDDDMDEEDEAETGTPKSREGIIGPAEAEEDGDVSIPVASILLFLFLNFLPDIDYYFNMIERLSLKLLVNN